MNLVFLLLYFYVPKLRGKRCLSLLFHILDVKRTVLNVESSQVVSCHPIYRINSISACDDVLRLLLWFLWLKMVNTEWWCLILFVWDDENANMKLSFTHFVCKVCLTDVLNCYIDGKFLIHGHGYRVLVLWSVIIQDFRLCAVLSALFLLLVVVKPVQVQLERNQIALLARVLALLHWWSFCQ